MVQGQPSFPGSCHTLSPPPLHSILFAVIYTHNSCNQWVFVCATPFHQKCNPLPLLSSLPCIHQISAQPPFPQGHPHWQPAPGQTIGLCAPDNHVPFILFYLFLEREEGERERNINVLASCTPPTRDLAHNPSMCLPWLRIEPVILWFTGNHVPFSIINSLYFYLINAYLFC